MKHTLAMLACALALSGCGPDRQKTQPELAAQGTHDGIEVSGPDPFGVVCYSFPAGAGRNGLSCVRVRP